MLLTSCESALARPSSFGGGGDVAGLAASVEPQRPASSVFCRTEPRRARPGVLSPALLAAAAKKAPAPPSIMLLPLRGASAAGGAGAGGSVAGGDVSGTAASASKIALLPLRVTAAGAGAGAAATDGNGADAADGVPSPSRTRSSDGRRSSDWLDGVDASVDAALHGDGSRAAWPIDRADPRRFGAAGGAPEAGQRDCGGGCLLYTSPSPRD